MSSVFHICEIVHAHARLVIFSQLYETDKSTNIGFTIKIKRVLFTVYCVHHTVSTQREYKRLCHYAYEEIHSKLPFPSHNF